MSEQEPKKSFFLGLSIGIALISTVAFFILLGVTMSGSSSNSNSAANVAVNAAAGNPTVEPTEPSANPSALSDITTSDYVRGDYNAPVTLIIFSDYQCPYCASHEATIKQILNDYKGKVRMVFRNFPLSFHAEAEKAAEATECAGEQGKFWEMHDKIFEANENGTMSVDQWKTIAKALGLNTSKFNDCLDSGKYVDKIKADMAEGQAAGVSGTPATFVNGELVTGAVPYEQFKTIIDSNL